MSMPIQRQSEQFSAFDSGPRWERDRTSNDLPKGLAALINTTGPRIQAGLLNTRQAGYPSDGPRDHGGAGPDGGPSVPDWYYDDDNDNDGDPPDKNFVSENPWGHGDRRASRHPFDRAADARLAKDGGCTCWEGYERVPGTEPCASGSCRKKTAAPTDWSQARSGPLVDSDLREQDPDDYFRWRPHGGPSCPTCDRPLVAVSGPHCRHTAQMSYEDTMKHIDETLAAGEQTDEAKEYDMFAGGSRRGAPMENSKPAFLDWAGRQNRSLNSLDDLDVNDFAEEHGLDDPDYHDLLNWVNSGGHLNRTAQTFTAADEMAMDPAQMQAPMGGGFMPAHRVGLPWRDQIIPGTVINLDGPNVAVRWDDGQYSTEEPHNIQLL